MLRFRFSRNLSFTVTVHKWHEPYVVQQFLYEAAPYQAQRRRHRGDRWNFSLQSSLQTWYLEFSQIFTKNDVFFCNMAIVMKNWTWSPRVGFRIFVGIALGCFQVRRNVFIALCIPRFYQLKQQSDQSNLFFFLLPGSVCCQHLKTIPSGWNWRNLHQQICGPEF